MNNTNTIQTNWLWPLFSAAVGAGILYLPINAGIQGIWPLLFLSLFSLPMIYLPHRALTRVVLSASAGTTNINDIIYENFSSKFCLMFSLCYFVAIYPMILIYSVGITNTINSVLINSLSINFIPRYVLSFILLATLTFIIMTKEDMIRKVTKMLALPLATFLFLLSIYLIPKWNFEYFKIIPSSFNFFETVIYTLPVMIFTFNFSPIISTFTLYHTNHSKDPEKDTTAILRRASVILFIFITFFIVSCVLSLDPENMARAKKANMNILVYMGNHFNDPILTIINPIIAVIAMTGAFLSNFFGAKESVIGLMEQKLHAHKVKSKRLKHLEHLAIALIIIPSYIVSVVDTNILNLMGIISGPMLATLLFIFPIYAFYNIKKLNKYHQSKTDKMGNYFTLVAGIIGFSAMLYPALKYYLS